MRALIGMVIAISALEAQPVYDLLLKGGWVIDPKNGRSAVMDVAVAGGKVAQVANEIPASAAKQVVNAAGLFVTPGLVDIHTHLCKNCDRRLTPEGAIGVPPDAFSFRSGITTVVDAGSVGWRDFPEFRQSVIATAETRVLAFLNIVAGGMNPAKENDPAEMDAEGAARAAKENADVIVGFKSAHYAGPGWASVDGALKAGQLTGLPVMVDFGRVTQERNLTVLLEQKLRPGDIYTHCYSGHRQELLENGKVNPAMIAGRKRGVIFDVGHGGGSFYWYVAAPAYEQGFTPDSISTDLHTGSMNSGMKDMLNVMSKFVNLGSTLDTVIRLSTWNPAQEIHRPQLGNLDVGAEADIAVLRLVRGNFGFIDSAGARASGTQMLVCELTLRGGKVVWDLNGRAAPDWRTFKYQKESWK